MRGPHPRLNAWREQWGRTREPSEVLGDDREGHHRPDQEPAHSQSAGHTRVRCELRAQGPYGWEAQFPHNEELVMARTFHQRLDPTRTPREMAIAWTTEERKAMEAGR
jgi:hypothetical protein